MAETDNADPLWTEGVCGDDAAILRDGVMVPIEKVLEALNGGTDFLAGYEAAKADAISLCLKERMARTYAINREHNTALNTAIVVIRGMDGRDALSRREMEGI